MLVLSLCKYSCVEIPSSFFLNTKNGVFALYANLRIESQNREKLKGFSPCSSEYPCIFVGCTLTYITLSAPPGQTLLGRTQTMLRSGSSSGTSTS